MPVGNDDGQEDDGPVFPWLPPDDRLWRHPSEVGPPVDAPAADPVGPAGHVWTVAIAAGVVGALVASAVLIAVGSMHARTTTKIVTVPSPRPPTSILANATLSGGAMLWPQVVEYVAPSVVAVSTTVGGSQSESGSGVIFAGGGKETDIITAYDLVSGGGTISVSFNGGQSQKAKLVGKDPTTGIAVLSVDSTGHALPAMGTVSELSRAQEVLALGASDANASNYTEGDISGLDDSVTDQSDSTLVGMLAIGGGPISPNTDGGAIVDQSGWVVGIYSLAASGGSSDQDESYAVPIDTAMHVALDLMAGKKPTHPWLGIASATDVSTSTTARPGRSAGASIGAVCADSPASHAGLKQGDLVTAVGGQPVRSSASLITILSHDRVGRLVKVGYRVPQGRALTATLRVADEPSNLAC
jgi:putative serine protease PepD